MAHHEANIKPVDIGAQHHQQNQQPIIKTEHILHHLILLHLDHTNVHTLLQTITNLLLDHRARHINKYAQQRQHALNNNHQQLDKKLGHDDQPVHRTHHPARHRLKIELTYRDWETIGRAHV